MSTPQPLIDQITVSRHELKLLVSEAVREVISPWLTMDDMMHRYHVKTTKTIASMELRGDIPRRTKSGLWLRGDVESWEKSSKIAA